MSAGRGDVAARAGDERTMFDRGWAHFLQGLHSPERLVRSYPTRDRHSAEDEAEFLRGWNEARREHDAAEGAVP